MERDQVVELVNACGVRGLAYLVVLALLNGSTVRELSACVRSNRHTTSEVLFGLEMRGLVVRVQVGRSDRWHVSLKGSELLAVSDSNPQTNSRLSLMAEIPPSSPTTTALLDLKGKEAAAVAADGVVGGKTANEPENVDIELAAAFQAAGIGRNAWVGLAAFEHVTADVVRGHDAYRRAMGESTGLLIVRLRSGDQVPVLTGVTRESVGDSWARVLAERRK